MRGRHTISPLQLVVSIALLSAFCGARADAAPVYQLTDLGAWPNPTNPSLTAAAAGHIVYDIANRPARIDNSGTVTTERLNSSILDPTTLSAIQAPYEPGYAGLFPAVGGSSYQAGFVASTDPSSPWQAMIWDGNGGHALGPVPSATAWAQYQIPHEPDSGWSSIALGVNDLGHAVGSVGNGFSNRTATTWGLGPDGTDPLDAIRSQLGSYSEAFGINGQNQVVGTFKSFTDPRAFLLDGTDLVDLNSTLENNQGLTLLAATGINDRGQIVGVASDADGNPHAFLLTPGLGEPTPVPEPSTLAVFGLMAVAFCARSRRLPRWIAGSARG